LGEDEEAEEGNEMLKKIDRDIRSSINQDDDDLDLTMNDQSLDKSQSMFV